jgi:hypothetical protein
MPHALPVLFIAFITVIRSHEEYNLWSSSVCSFSQLPVTSSLLRANVPFDTLNPNTSQGCFPLYCANRWRGRFILIIFWLLLLIAVVSSNLVLVLAVSYSPLRCFHVSEVKQCRIYRGWTKEWKHYETEEWNLFVLATLKEFQLATLNVLSFIYTL